jgi:uncharacterized membrane protein
MILAHVVDAWTRPADHQTIAFRNVTILGGLAAPLFLWLAGVGLALGGERASCAGRRRAVAHAIARRGLEIFVLAFVFRLQALVVSPGGPLIALFRVDILNVMGPAIVVSAGVWWAAGRPSRAVALCGGCAAVIALITPVVRSALWVDALPTWFQWYLRPAGEMTTFTLLPWSGFVLAGAAIGSVLSQTVDPRAERLAVLRIAAAGALLVAAGFGTAALPTIYANSSFWTSSPTYFAIRIGLVMLALAAMFALFQARPQAPMLAVLERFGRRSLFVYWIHVELVYGYLTWPIHRSLPIWSVMPLYVVFCGVMYGALQLYERGGWRDVLPFNRAGVPDRVLQG